MAGRESRITKAVFKKFCCFDDFVVSFDRLTCLVGPNNGGKTTILKGIRFALDAIDISKAAYEIQLAEYEQKEQTHKAQTLQEKETLEKELETERQKALNEKQSPDDALRQRKQTERLRNEEQRRKQVELAFQQREKSLRGSTPKWTCSLPAVAKRQNIEDMSCLVYRKNLRLIPSITLLLRTGQETWHISFKVRYESKVVEIESHRDGDNSDVSTHVRRELLGDLIDLQCDMIPPIGPLLPYETDLAYPAVQDTINNGRPGDVWRNRIRWLNEGKSPAAFQRIIDRIQNCIGDFHVNPPSRTREGSPRISLSYKEHNIAYDISSSGSGVQMVLAIAAWMELSDAHILLIDEPDAHLHSQIQRQLAEFLQNGVSDARQIIIASHAPDLIEELPVESIVWIDSHEDGGSQCSDIEKTLVMLGVVSNRAAIGFLKSDVHLYFEDKPDIHVLQLLMRKAGKDVLCQRARPMKLHGCGDTKHLAGLSRLLQSCFHKTVATISIVDSDYRPEQKPQVDGNVLTVCLPCKELENLLLLQPSAIHSVAVEVANNRARIGEQIQPPSLKELESKIDEITSSEEITEVARNNYLLKTPGPNAEQIDPSEFDVKWGSLEYRRRRAPGKMVFAKLRQWLQDQYQVSFSLTRCFNQKEYKMDESLQSLFDDIDNHVNRVLAAGTK